MRQVAHQTVALRAEAINVSDTGNRKNAGSLVKELKPGLIWPMVRPTDNS